jgi:iron complex outermembrane receptor protein
MHFKGCSSVAAAVAWVLFAPAAEAQSRAQFDLPPQPLSTALRAVGTQTRINVLFDAALVEGLSAPALKAELTLNEAFIRLLQGSGLQHRFLDERTVMVVQAPYRMETVAMVTDAPAPAPASDAGAQRAPASPVSEVEQITVTASRIARDGFTAPTPTTVLSSVDIEARAANNVTELINEIPAFRPSQTPAAAARGGSTSGGSFLDLRGLNGQGPSAIARTLVLVDGRRFVTSNIKGQVDLNLIPSSLIERAEVVTGGASAAWGSDAVAGVVNLLLKSDLEGFHTHVGYGQAEEGDYEEIAASFALGTRFASDRGHVLLGAEYVDNKGIPDSFVSRDWGRQAWGTVTLPANRPAGLPSRIVAPDVRISDRMTPGGIIVGGPLDNIEFLGGEQTRVFQPGAIVGGNQMIGGGNEGIYFTGGSNLVNPIERYAVLGRVTYDLTDSLSAFVEVSRGESEFHGWSASRRDDGNLTIQRDNAFLPESIRQQMETLNLQTITIGRIAYDDNYSNYTRYAEQATNRVVFGLDGEFAGDWGWSFYYQWGENEFLQRDQATITANYRAAVDAIRDANGNIICRPGAAGADPGCVPMNIFGRNSPSDAAVAYVTGYSIHDITTRQHVAAFDVTGSPFSTWAGPVSIATGLEYRKEEARAISDENSMLSRYDLSNYKPLSGSYFTREVFGEAVVPLLSSVPGADLLELNAAARRTDYSTSGAVTTWKAGLTYQPIDDIKFRATQSRDIRAPNISELFSQSTFSRVSVNNRFTGQGGQQVDQVTIGNVNLRPEKADTFTAGIVFQPSFIQGFRASVDYYDIEIDDVITQFGAQLLVDRCYEGMVELCSNIIFGPNQQITRVNSPQMNFNSLETSGWDIELSYALSLDRIGLPGNLAVRAFGTIVNEMTTIDPGGVVDRVRQTVPEHSASLSVIYRLDRLTTNAQVRYLGTTVQDATLIGPDDPSYSPALSNSINRNTRGRVFYLNLSGQYQLLDGEGTRMQVYAVVNNVTDRSPPPFAGSNPTGASLYDLVGRAFKVGFRLDY